MKRYRGYIACKGKGVVYRFCSGNPNIKTQFGRPRHRRVDNIKTDFQENRIGEHVLD
jgi:hypothetical protein